MTSRNLELLRPLIKKDAEILSFIDTFAEKWGEQISWQNNNTVLLQALDEYEYITQYFKYGSTESAYRWLQSQTSTDDTIKAEQNKIGDRDQDYSQKIIFFEIGLSDLDEERRQEILQDKELQKYGYFLQRLYEQKAHTLSKEEQIIEDRYAKTSYTKRYEFLSEKLAHEGGIVGGDEKTFEEVMVLVSDDNEVISKEAVKERERIMSGLHSTAVYEMNTICEYKKQYDIIHHYERPEQTAALRDRISLSSMDSAISVLTKNFSLSQDRYSLKAKLLGQETITYHERNRKIGTLTREFSREEAQKIVMTVFSRLDPEFGRIAEDIFKERIDVFPKKGKQGGAFAAALGTHTPDYMFLNYNKKPQDIVTLGHEMGHMVHFIYARTQNALQRSGGSIMAEVASTFFEDFVFQEMLTYLTLEEQYILKANMIENKISTIIRQVAAHNFEKELHTVYREKGYVPQINELFQKHMQSYMGPSVTFVDGADMGWIYWGHFRNFFWTYNYSLALCLSQSLQASYHENNDNLSLFKQFMSSGGKGDVADTFGELGFDTTKEVFRQKGCDVLADLINDFKKLPR